MQQSVLAGRYRLERQLGKGGMGSVWLAEHLALKSWVAVKLMDPAIAATSEGAERFRREAQAAASLRSAHVVQVLDYGLHESTPFLVMELLQGESLAACLERERRITPERTVAVITQVARALGRAHAAGIVHRDLKPDNVFLVREDDQELVKVLDFGIAKTPAAQFGGVETRTGVTMGTPHYMSPEQVEGKKAVDHRSDLWAMAVITCECMTGTRPFEGSTYGELLLNICARPIPVPSSQGPVPPSFDAWFSYATNRDPERRFASAQELAGSLRDVVAGAPAPRVVAGAPPPRVDSGTEHMPFAPTGTGAALPATPSGGLTAVPLTQTSTTHTSQPLEVTSRSSGRSALPWIVAAGVGLLGVALAAVLLLRPKAPDADAALAASSEAVAVPPTTPAVTAGGSSAPASPVPAPPPAAPAPAPIRPAPAEAVTAAQPVATPEPPAPATADLPSTPAPTPAPSATAVKTARCFSDPFSGQIRLAGSGRAPSTTTFACKQDPFTGKYRKL